MIQAENILNDLVHSGMLLESEQEVFKKLFLEHEMLRNYDCDYKIYIETFNKLSKQKQKGDIKSRELFYSPDNYYPIQDRLKALGNMIEDSYFKENSYLITPTNMLLSSNVGKYINKTPSETTHKSNENSDINMSKNTTVNFNNIGTF